MKIKLFLLALALFGLTSCTQPDKAYMILERDGYTNINIEGYAWFGCSEDDNYRTKFTAIKNNQSVEGVVCSGFMKGSTVRTFD